MTFNSYIFIFVFLPICLLGYYSIKCYNARLVFLTGMSLWFYGYFNIRYLPVILVSTAGNYIAYYFMSKVSKCNDQLKNAFHIKRLILYISLIFNIGMLAYFKYFDFFVENINAVFNTNIALRNILLPLGISFFTFQQISFLIDSYKTDFSVEEGNKYTIIEYASYVTFFPQLVAGPIVTHDVLVPQLQEKNKNVFNFSYFSKGITLFTLGLAKKVLLADVYGRFVAIGYGNVNGLNTTTALLTCFFYSLQIYFDFSGYSDMAIGLGWMMNIDLPENFDSPYKALSVTEFWKRWHMTLTSFFTKYVYIPLGGNKKGPIRTYINILIVFSLSGLWHGAGWTFVLWGMMHGIAQIIERILKEYWSKIHPGFSWLVTFGFVNVAWVYFRANSITDVHILLSKILQFSFGQPSDEMLAVFRLPEWAVLTDVFHWKFIDLYPNIFLASYCLLPIVVILALPNARHISEILVKKASSGIVIAALLVWCIVSFTSVSTFLYFNF